MKKILHIFLIVSLIISSYHQIQADDIGVGARVSVINRLPHIIGVQPSYSPVVLGRSSLQTFAVNIEDFEGDTISYTITPQYGAVSRLSGTITDVTKLQTGKAYINFAYLSTSNIAQIGASIITITLNDGVNGIVSKNIDIYTY